MKLFFKGHDYKFAAEQIMLMMFPDERPEYPEKHSGNEDFSAYISLSFGKKYVTGYVKLNRYGEISASSCREQLSAITDDIVKDRVCQRLIKNAFYKASVAMTGKKPAWGSLTGIRPGKIATKLLEEGASAEKTVKTMEREYFVSTDRAKLCIDTAEAGLKVKNALEKKDIALYIGIPFCPTRCAYCSFVSQSTAKSMGLIEPFLKALYLEMEAVAGTVKKLGLRIISVYLGGGTPTTLSAQQLRELMEKLYGLYDLGAVKEFTVEAGRPDTITAEKCAVLKEYGVTRISVNPQTMSDEILEVIGRKHTAEDIIKAFEIVRNSGIEAVNMDLIAGLPGDSAEGFDDTLSKVLSLDPENVTVHTLSLKKGARIMLEKTPLPPEEDVGKMLESCAIRLTEKGHRPYYLYRQKFISGGFENVGWAKEGYDSLYNILIMEELCSIIAMGGGASTKLVNAEKGKIERIFNPKYPKEYIENIDAVISKKELVTKFYESEILGGINM